MYITRFIYLDGAKKDFQFLSLEEAKARMTMFANDETGIYKCMAVLDQGKNNVEAILLFSEGKPLSVISDGDIVRLKDQFSEPDERKYLFVVKNINEVTERIDITCINTNMAIPPTESVGAEMVETLR